ncbi:MAG: DUF6036 family nucleotidyltransferase [Lachnospiraceae bacterium]|nr:DUF6036 family nucleotidyltransferase [Lachnospiraceae bacterium]
MKPCEAVTKDNMNVILNDMAKQFRKKAGRNASAEIILIGGASVLANYDFRESTMDIDAFGRIPSMLKDIARETGDKYNLENGWFNSDFMKTESYSPQLVQYSKYYRTFANVMEVRTINSEHLIAMKLKSNRDYRSDQSDIAGILLSHESKNDPITFERIDKAVSDLYGGWQNMPEHAKDNIQATLDRKNYESEYQRIRSEEKENAKTLITFEQDYPNVLSGDNIKDILSSLKKKSRGEIVEEKSRHITANSDPSETYVPKP